MNNNFIEFRGLYEISKTLRFELKPVWETEKLIVENEVFPKDKIVYESYKKIRPFLDNLHTKFIEESLENLNLDFNNIEVSFLSWQKEIDKIQKDKLKKEIFWEKWKWGLFWKLRKDVNNKFITNWENWKKIYENKVSIDEKWKEKNYKIKWDWYKILLSDTNLDILSEIYTEENFWEKVIIEKYIKNPNYTELNWEKKFILEKQNLFKSFKGFTTYFTNFNHSRENFYKDDWKSWRIATRIIDENLVFYLKNKKNFDEKYKENEKIILGFKEKLNNFWEKIDEFFSLDFYNKCYTWKQIEYYNQLIWELNSVINQEKQASFSLYTQNKKINENIKFNKYDFPIFKELYKQILSEKTTEQKFIEINNFEDIKIHLKELEEKNKEKNKIVQNLIKSISEKYQDYDFEKIYISKLSLNTISAKFFWSDKWHFIQEILEKEIWKKNKNWKLDLPDFIKLSDIKNVLEGFNKILLEDKCNKEEIYKEEFYSIEENNVFVKFLKIFEKEFINLIEWKKNNKWEYEIIWYNKSLKDLQENILNLSDFSEVKEEKEKQIEYIKSYLDSSLNIFRMMKYFALEKGKESVEAEYETEDIFYNEFKKFYTDNEIISYYNEFRNYLTKKAYSTNKIKLNFENGTLVDGWDKNKEPDNFWTLLKKNWKYFLALQVYWKKNIFYKKKWSWVEDIKEAFNINSWEDFYEKMDYKFLPDPKKMLPKVFFAKWNIDIFNPSKEILEIKENETFKTWDKFNLDDFYKIVDFYKESILKYPDWQIFDFNFSDTKTYKNLADFYREVELWSYNLSFKKVSQKYIFDNLKKWNIYLFEIYNKDFAENKTWKENLHTMYFKWLFEENNLQNVVLKLNWQAEIFRREASLKEKIDKERKTKIDIIENKRYTQDKIFFHCPIKLNFAKHNTRINQEILKYISNNKEINIIWIDRWEKHLAYYSVIDRNWNILKDKNWNLVKWSLNIVWNNQNYHDKLETREKERQEARWSWKTIWNIKDLKDGYISQVVHKLAELIINLNAIIVFEDLNSWFKRWRQKIERQVYQKLEKALIEKLNYLTFKDKNLWENWHYLSAYQLTEQFETFEKVWKQTWVIFYTDPSYTSSTCPACWFRKDLYLKYSNLKNALWDIEKIDSIIFDWKKFIFEYNNKKVFTDRDRKRNVSSEESWVKWWKTIDNYITKNLENLFNKFDINYTTWNNLILNIQEKNEKDLYKWVFDNFNAILSIRNATIKDNSRTWDFICCPCCDFDSRKENAIWIENWDDNWAYNIARKWIIILNKIDKALEDKKEISKIKWEYMIVKQIDWDNFTQK